MEALQQLFVVAGVLAALAAALWTLKNRGMIDFQKLPFGKLALSGSGERRLQIVERLQLTPQHTLCLVRLEGRTLLIGTAPSSCHLLDPKGDS